MSNFPIPECGVLCISVGDLTSKNALVFFTLLSYRKRYTEDYWLFLNPKSSGWVINIDCIINFVILNNKSYIFCYGVFNYDDILSLNMFFSKILNQLFLGIFCHNFLKRSKNYINFYLQYQSTATLEVSQFPLPQISKHQTAEQYQRSYDCGDLDLKSDVNQPASGKLW